MVFHRGDRRPRVPLGSILPTSSASRASGIPSRTASTRLAGGMAGHVQTSGEQHLEIPPPNLSPTIVIQNERKLAAA